MVIETNGARVAIVTVVGGISATGRRSQQSRWQQVPPGREIMPAQQGYGMVGFAMILEVDLLDIGDFVWLWEQ
uniref:Uncharacterized protein n=1 Tax=Romanomermis culicivorax TaxID=13658 RepID=A0A915I2J8_ROMCU